MLTTSQDGVPILEPRSVVRRRFILSLGFFASLGVLLALLLSSGSDDRIVGSGSTLIQPVIEKASLDYQARLNADDPDRPDATGGDWVSTSRGLDYEPVGSLGGILRVDDPEVDFAAADYPLSPEALADKGLVQFPLVIGSVAVVHNLGLASDRALRLDAATLAAIYMLEITRWNDPAIAELNPDIALPDLAINPVHRRDGSGSTYNFSTYLAGGSPDWAAAHGVGSVIAWPGGTGGERSRGMIEAIGAVPGSIGYVETGQAGRAGLNLAALRNAAGTYVLPSAAAMRAAIGSVDWDPATHFSRPLAAAQGVDSYPITTVTYALMRRAAASSPDTGRALRFLVHLSTRSTAEAEALGFLPLPSATTEAVRGYWQSELDFTN